MVGPRSTQIGFKIAACFAALALLSACGGGSGGATGGPVSGPPPSPPPPPPPPPPPSPPTTTNFDTAEFRQSDGPDFHNAVSAWESGITGANSLIAIIDTGIDLDSPEFAGRIHPDSTYVAGSGNAEAEDSHGTDVALVAAGARNDSGALGIAFDADILALRSDEPGSCATNTDDALDGCLFSDRSIARGVDQAIASGATVVNLSLGGSAPTSVLRQAIARAAAAGLVIVVAAGNDGDSTDAGIDPDQPDPFATGLLAAGGGNVIIVGSVDEVGDFSDFSNRAGNSATSFISARGEGICCIYEDGELRITTDANGDRFITLVSGTSFSAPQVSGAAALLAQAFPNLTGDQIVSILLDSARDSGAVGADAVFGTGILDIAAALAPGSSTTLSGSTTRLTLGDDTGFGSAAMGDALANAQLETIITDQYGRAYSYDVGSRLRNAAPQQRLLGAVQTQGRRVRAGSDDIALAFTVSDDRGTTALSQLRLSPAEADQARVIAGRVALKLSPDTDVAFGFAESANGLVSQLQGQSRPAFLIARSSVGDTGFFTATDASLAVRRQIGDWGLTLSAESGEAVLSQFRIDEGLQLRRGDRQPIRSVGFALDRQFGSLETAFNAAIMQEEGTVLGAFFHEAFGGAGADTIFLDANLAYSPAANWRIGGAFRQGFTRVNQAGFVTSSSGFQSQAWAFDVSRRNVIGVGDTLGFRLSQPLRVVNGGLTLNLPVAYDYSTESAILGDRFLALTPDGREIMGELAWSGEAFGGAASVSMFYRRQPGHIVAAPDDAGMALKWNVGF